MDSFPQGSRPKALVYQDLVTNNFSTLEAPQNEAWLIKFPDQQEHLEVCTIEMIYAEYLRLCNIETPDTQYFKLQWINGIHIKMRLSHI